MFADFLDQWIGLGGSSDLQSSEGSLARAGPQPADHPANGVQLQAHRLDMFDPFLVGFGLEPSQNLRVQRCQIVPATASRVAIATVLPPVTVSTPPRKAQNRSRPAVFQLTIEIASAVRNGAWPGRMPKLPLASSARKLSASSSTTTDRGVTIRNLMPRPRRRWRPRHLRRPLSVRASSKVPTM
jgi:hypothetical protein